MVFSATFSSFAVAFSLVLLITDSFALTDQVLKDLDGNVGLKATGKNSADIAKQAYGQGVPAAVAEDENMRFAGRKIISRSSTLEKKPAKTGNLDAKEAWISGNADKLPESSVEHLEYQTVNHELPTNNQLCSTYFKSAGPDNGGLECLPVSEKSGLDQESDNVPFQKLESEKQKAANEVVQLMNKDYQEAEGPQHKPPINNNLPPDQEP